VEFQPEVTRRLSYGQNPEVGERARRTYDRILEASLGVFDRRGVQGARMNDVARAAGLSRATVYQYFESKQHIVDALAARINHELQGLVDQLEPLDASSEGQLRLRQWLERLVTIMSAYAPVIEVWTDPSLQTSELAAMSERWSRSFGTELGLRLTGGVSNLDGAPIALALFGLVETVALKTASGDLDEPLGRLLDELSVVTHRGLFAVAKPSSR
jgi:AcrR family transcriptional regulator